MPPAPTAAHPRVLRASNQPWMSEEITAYSGSLLGLRSLGKSLDALALGAERHARRRTAAAATLDAGMLTLLVVLMLRAPGAHSAWACCGCGSE